MTTQSIQSGAKQFAADLFEHVRAMSADEPGVSRQGYSDLETAIHQYIANIAADLGMEKEIDPAGNMWLTYPGKDRTLPAVVSGSHADSVFHGGNYDGYAGIVSALSVAWWMHQIQFTPDRDFRVLLIRCEESSYFGRAYVGSLGMLGKLTEKDMALKHRSLPITLGDAIASQGYDLAPLMTGKPLVDVSKIAAFIELHIEQGPMLDRSDDRVGVVTGIRGNFRHKQVKCFGEAAHSGAVDKAFRHDAIMALARLLSRMDDHWQEWLDAGHDLVFTAGVVKTTDSAGITVIPGEVTFTLDMRSLKQETLDGFYALLLEEADAIAKERGVRFEFDARLACEPAKISERVCNHLFEVAQEYKLPARLIPSGAGHDSAVFGNAGIPAGMIFVANQKGSHNPHEAMEIDDFMIGVDLLWRTVENFKE